MVAERVQVREYEEGSVEALLREHPELPGMISRAQTKAAEVFPSARFTLDTRQYDEWDPPLTLYVWSAGSPDAWLKAFNAFSEWLAPAPWYDRSLLLIMPMRESTRHRPA